MIKRFFAVLLLAACTLTAQATRPLTIIHTNDLHARLQPSPDGRGGFASVAAVIRREKANCRHCIVLNCGDLVQGTPVSGVFRGIPIYEMANLFGIDAATLGNHEYDYGTAIVADYLKIAEYPIVSANLVDGSGKLVLKPYVILNSGGLRVGIIGAMTSELYRLQLPDRLGDVRALPVVDSVKKYIPELRGQSDVIVLIGHLNPEDEADVRAGLQDVDVVIGGHIHVGTKDPIITGNQWMGRLSAYGVEVGRLELEVDPARKKVVSSKWSRLPVDSKSIQPAADMASEVARWESKVTETMDVRIGAAKRTIPKAEMKGLIEKALCEMTGADLAFTGRGGIRDELPKGPILVRHIWNVFPFDNKVVIGTFKGSELPASITEGKTIDPKKTYTVATNEFSAANQSSPRELNTSGLDFPTVREMQRDLLIEWVKKNKVIE